MKVKVIKKDNRTYYTCMYGSLIDADNFMTYVKNKTKKDENDIVFSLGHIENGELFLDKRPTGNYPLFVAYKKP